MPALYLAVRFWASRRVVTVRNFETGKIPGELRTEGRIVCVDPYFRSHLPRNSFRRSAASVRRHRSGVVIRVFDYNENTRNTFLALLLTGRCCPRRVNCGQNQRHEGILFLVVRAWEHVLSAGAIHFRKATYNEILNLVKEIQWGA